MPQRLGSICSDCNWSKEERSPDHPLQPLVPQNQGNSNTFKFEAGTGFDFEENLEATSTFDNTTSEDIVEYENDHRFDQGKTNNRMIPEDIPQDDNDSVLEEQIRLAAMNEKDPEKKKRLWNEYRKYKGLPQKE